MKKKNLSSYPLLPLLPPTAAPVGEGVPSTAAAVGEGDSDVDIIEIRRIIKNDNFL